MLGLMVSYFGGLRNKLALISGFDLIIGIRRHFTTTCVPNIAKNFPLRRYDKFEQNEMLLLSWMDERRTDSIRSMPAPLIWKRK